MIRVIMNDVLTNHMSDFTREINCSLREILDAEMKSIKDLFKDFKESMDFMNNTFEALNKQHTAA